MCSGRKSPCPSITRPAATPRVECSRTGQQVLQLGRIHAAHPGQIDSLGPGEERFPVRPNALAGMLPVSFRRNRQSWRRGVKLRQEGGQTLGCGGLQLTFVDQLVKHLLGGQSLHLDDPVDNFAGASSAAPSSKVPPNCKVPLGCRQMGRTPRYTSGAMRRFKRTSS